MPGLAGSLQGEREGETGRARKRWAAMPEPEGNLQGEAGRGGVGGESD